MTPHRKIVALGTLISLWAILVAACGRTGPAPSPSPASDATLSWFKSGGLGSAGKYRDILATDLDGDSFMDIAATSSEPGKVAIWYGDRPGRARLPLFLPFKADVRGIAGGDLNGDGLADLVVSVQREASGIMTWINGPERKWERGIEPTKINRYEGVEMGDVNGDGNLDVIAANSTSAQEGGVQVWLGDGRGDWIVETGPTVAGRYMDVAFADFDRDGALDIAATSWGMGGAVEIWLGDGTGKWTPAPPLAEGNFNAVGVADIDGDGNADLLAGTYRQGLHLFCGDGAGGFVSVPSPVDSGSYWRAVVRRPAGGEGIDLLAGTIDGKGIRGWSKADGKSWKEIRGVLPALGNYYDMELADLDADGEEELVVASLGEGVRIFSGRHWPDAAGGTPASAGIDDGVREVLENEVYTTKNGYPEYKIGPGDILEFTLWEPDKTTKEEVEVMPDGTISFIFVEDLHVNGLTAKELDEAITGKLGEYIRSPRVTIRVSRYQSKWASILGPGRVQHGGAGGGGERGRRGGRYYLDGRVTLVELLSGASISRDANLREVLVTRDNGRTLKLNVYKAMTLGDKTQDIIVDHGDSVYVSIVSKEENRVFIFGEIDDPGAYTFTGGSIPVLDAVSAAGGPTVFGLLEHTKIVRGDPVNPEVISTDLEKLLETGDQSQNVALLDGDLVYVPRTIFGDIRVFIERISPLLRLVAVPLNAFNTIENYYIRDNE